MNDLRVLREYENEGQIITEFTRDCETVCFTQSKSIPTINPITEIPSVTLEDKINYIYYKLQEAIS
jgi:hypothetical protein